jgi:hypothetical protein
MMLSILNTNPKFQKDLRKKEREENKGGKIVQILLGTQ